MTIIEPAYGKINLYLHVTGKRSDGYHLLDTLMVPVDFHDVITLSESDSFSLSVEGEFAGKLPSQKDNIVTRAVELLAKRAQKQTNLAIHIQKNIPIGAGMAGGSADAAATLRALNQFWQLGYSLEELAETAIQVGADVPFCLYQHPAFVSGIGEVITPITEFPEMFAVLVNPRIHVDTPSVFQAGIQTMSGTVKKPATLPNTLADWIPFLQKQQNDLVENACLQAPVIPEIISLLQHTSDCLLAQMSGSGATCFGLFENHQQAQNVMSQLKRSYPQWWCTATKILSAA